ncbi:dymeclin-like isoform X1 [Daphnia pulex]|uniref:dymeclin-like isoform X1 n=1 Tax=Daphnia pulex TaxID=6669 RepID=UPI001EE03FFC|nr:dymeclin-like isoform X1 [Daphnia pulex]XP_046451729.1 dymeclin-like isoform X1 [Daphnia pulex]
MGAQCSSVANLNSNEHLFQLCGSTPMTANDPTWNQLFSFNLQIPLSSLENHEVIEGTAQLFQLLESNNQATRNTSALLRVFLSRATELKASAQCDNRIFIWQTCNALFIVRVIFSHWIRLEKEAVLIKKFSFQEENSCESLLENLAVQLVEILVDVPLKEETALLHRESVQTLMLLLFVAASSYLINNKSIIFKCLMHGPGALHAGLLTRTLLQHYCQQQSVPVRWLRKPEQGGSIVLGLATGLWSLISRNSSTAESVDAVSDFASQSLLLLLVLTNHCSTEKNWSNPYRQALLSFTDSQDPVQVSPVHPSACFRLDYSVLYSTLCDRLGDERTTLLLYMLLHQHQQFRNYVYTHADIQRMVIALLQELFNGDDQGSHHLYMSLIILLLLSEDEGFNSNIHNVVVRNPLWYTDRVLNEISLGGLAVLVIARTIQRNIVKASDKYLHTNCLATLANMAAHFRRLHPYTCQRLVSLLCTLNKRRIRVVQQIKSDVKGDSATGASREELEQDLSILEEVLRMLLEILNAAFTHQLGCNQNLIYSVLHKREVLDVLRRQPAFQDIVANLDTVSNYFNNRISQLNEPGVNEILQSIQLGCVDFPKDQLKKFPELKFRYVEEDQPEEFFIPYVWSMVQSTSALCWSNDEITMGMNNETK